MHLCMRDGFFRNTVWAAQPDMDHEPARVLCMGADPAIDPNVGTMSPTGVGRQD